MTSKKTSARRTRTVLSLSALALLVTGGVLYAGPLDPPAGPVVSSYKTLTEVEPRTAINATNTPGDNDVTPSLFKITQPGSYYLTGNITGVVGKHGIEIVASGVTLDLNGFELVGGVAARGGLSGVFANLNGQTNVTIRNGSARNWTDRGVSLSIVSGGRVTGVSAINCLVGILSGPASTISDCSAFQSSLGGIQASLGGCMIKNCTASGNLIGIVAGNGCLVTNCSANFNTDAGISAGSGGSQTPDGSTVADCTAGFNTTNGIQCFSTCVARNNTCHDNGNNGDGAGIWTGFNGAGVRIEGNQCSGADRGIEAPGPRNLIIRNTCSGNTINWVVGGNSVCGPIQNHTGSQRPGVFGFSAPEFIGEANDNFSY